MALEQTEIVLPARGRFDLRATVLSHAYPLPPFRWHDGPRPVLERAEQLPDGSVHLLRIRQVPRGVVLEVTGRDAREIEVLAPVAARVRRMLGLDQDLAGFHRVCAREPLLRSVARLGLGHLLRGTAAFEDVVKVLAASNSTWNGALRSVTRLTFFGRRCPARPALRAFPSPAVLARVPVRRLQERTGLGHRATWIRMLARDLVAGRRDLETIERLPVAEAARTLRTVQGLGPVGVSWLLLLLGHHDEPMLGRVTRAFTRRTLGGDEERLEHWLRRQRPWRGLALWFAARVADPAAAAPFRTIRSPAAPVRRAARS